MWTSKLLLMSITRPPPRGMTDMSDIKERLKTLRWKESGERDLKDKTLYGEAMDRILELEDVLSLIRENMSTRLVLDFDFRGGNYAVNAETITSLLLDAEDLKNNTKNLGETIAKQQAEIERLNSRSDLYSELLYAVHTKTPEESRHETALRYIQERESRTNPPQSNTPPTKEETP